MKTYGNIKYLILLSFGFALVLGCSKLDTQLNSTLSTTQAIASLGASGPQLILNGAYTDLAGIWGGQDMLW